MARGLRRFGRFALLMAVLAGGAWGPAAAAGPVVLPRSLGTQELGATALPGVATSFAIGDVAPLPVPYYSQRDERWGCSQLGTCGCDLNTCSTSTVTTIADAGCYPTSQAMVFAYYAGGAFMDPGQYNQCLMANQGYTAFPGACSGGACGALDDPPAACRPAGLQYLGPSLDKALLDADLRSGHPAIAVTGVGVSGRLPHAVVVIGKRGGHYLVNDPYLGTTPYHVSEMAPEAIYGFHRWAGNVPPAAAGTLPQAGSVEAPAEEPARAEESPAEAIPAPSTGPQQTSPVLGASYLRDLSIPDGAAVPSGRPFAKAWSVSNSGNVPWPDGTRLERVGGSRLATRDSVALPALAPGQAVRVWVPMRSPLGGSGPAREEWRLATPDGDRFGDTLTAEITVMAALGRRAANWSMFEAAQRPAAK